MYVVFLQIRAAEDLLSLTRIMKEAWLFGRLQTVGASEAETRAEAAAVGVVKGLRRLQQGGGGGDDGVVEGSGGSGEEGKGSGEGGEGDAG